MTVSVQDGSCDTLDGRWQYPQAYSVLLEGFLCHFLIFPVCIDLSQCLFRLGFCDAASAIYKTGIIELPILNL